MIFFVFSKWFIDNFILYIVYGYIRFIKKVDVFKNII